VSNKRELLEFLSMVRLKERKLDWALKQKGIKNIDLSVRLGIKVRRLQQLRSEYKKSGIVPRLKKDHRPRTNLSPEDLDLIEKVIEESKLSSAVMLRLYIAKYYQKNLPYGKIHKYLLKKGLSKEDPKKKKQRKYCRYERKHSFSLVHLDWHQSKAVQGKQVCVVEDDASRMILTGGEFDNAFEEYNIQLFKEAQTFTWEKYNSIILQANTDKGSQFYANKGDKDGEKAKCEFEKFLEEQGIVHIPSRRNHPQTNGKEERWFRTYEENRHKFTSFHEFMEWYNNRIHLGLNRKQGVTPKEAIINKLRQESLIGLFLKD